MVEKSTFRERFVQRVPPFLQDPSVWVPLIAGFYILLLGLCVTGALKRQKLSIRELRREEKKVFTRVDGKSDDEPLVKPTNSGLGKKRAGKRGVSLGDWDNIGCRS